MGDCLRAGTYTISLCNQPPRSTQPSIPPRYSRLIEYQPFWLEL